MIAAEAILAGLGIGSVIGQTIVGGVFDHKNINIQKQNLDMQQSNLDYQRAIQQKAWSREDNAVQRRVADLKAAGLNPVLAAGSAANSGPIVSTTAPQRETINLQSKFDQAQTIMALLKMKQDISTTVAQQKYLESQKEQSDSATKLNDIQTKIKQHDYDIYKDTGISSNATGWPKAISDGFSMISNQIKGTKGEITNKIIPPPVQNIIQKANSMSAGKVHMIYGNWWNRNDLWVDPKDVEKYKSEGWQEFKK